MQRKYIRFTLYIFLCASVFAGCGRKQRNFLYFPPEKTLNLTKLDLPAVKGIKAQKTDLGIHISWNPLFTSKMASEIRCLEKNFVGFDLFRLENNATFIPKKPINTKPITTNFFLDKSGKSSEHATYSIQPIFKFETQVLRGPSSQVIKISD